MSSFVIKNIAILSMLIDHTKNIIEWRFWLFYLIGRIAFPLFAFQTTIGYENTKDIKKYLKRLLVFALISQLPYSLYYIKCLNVYKVSLNVLFTLGLGIVCMYVYDIKNKENISKKEKVIFYIIKIAIISIIAILAEISNVDYGAFGVVLILFIHIFYNKNKVIFSLGYILLITEQFILSYYQKISLEYFIPLLIGGLLPLVAMLLYNGKKGKGLKYLFYIFYPVHLIILVLIKIFMLN